MWVDFKKKNWFCWFSYTGQYLLQFQQICDIFLPVAVLSAVFTATGQHNRLELLGRLSPHLDLEVLGYFWIHHWQLCMVQVSTEQVGTRTISLPDRMDRSATVNHDQSAN